MPDPMSRKARAIRSKAGLLEPQSPAMERTSAPRHVRRSQRDRTVTVSPLDRRAAQLSSCRATANEAVQGVERGASVALGRSIRPDTGSPTGREAQGDGVAVVVADGKAVHMAKGTGARRMECGGSRNGKSGKRSSRQRALESRMRLKNSCPVWGEGAGKVPDGNSNLSLLSCEWGVSC